MPTIGVSADAKLQRRVADAIGSALPGIQVDRITGRGTQTVNRNRNVVVVIRPDRVGRVERVHIDANRFGAALRRDCVMARDRRARIGLAGNSDVGIEAGNSGRAGSEAVDEVDVAVAVDIVRLVIEHLRKILAYPERGRVDVGRIEIIIVTRGDAGGLDGDRDAPARFLRPDRIGCARGREVDAHVVPDLLDHQVVDLPTVVEIGARNLTALPGEVPWPVVADETDAAKAVAEILIRRTRTAGTR